MKTCRKCPGLFTECCMQTVEPQQNVLPHGVYQAHNKSSCRMSVDKCAMCIYIYIFNSATVNIYCCPSGLVIFMCFGAAHSTVRVKQQPFVVTIKCTHRPVMTSWKKQRLVVDSVSLAFSRELPACASA